MKQMESKPALDAEFLLFDLASKRFGVEETHIEKKNHVPQSNYFSKLHIVLVTETTKGQTDFQLALADRLCSSLHSQLNSKKKLVINYLYFMTLNKKAFT